MKKILSLALVAVLGMSMCMSALAMEDKTLDELRALITEAQNAIEQNYTITYETSEALCELTKREVQQKIGGTLNWPWFDWMYERTRDSVTVTTRVAAQGGLVDGQYTVKAIYEQADGVYQLKSLQVGDRMFEGEPAAQNDTEALPVEPAVEPTVEPTVEPIIEPTPEPTLEAIEETEDETVSSSFGMEDFEDDDELIDEEEDWPDDEEFDDSELDKFEEDEEEDWLDDELDGESGDGSGEDYGDDFGEDEDIIIDESMWDEDEEVGDGDARQMPEEGTDEQSEQPIEAAEPMPTPQPLDDVTPIVSMNSKGDRVRHVQTWLIRMGYLQGAADGVFGAQSRDAVKKFQSDNALTITGSVTEMSYHLMAQKAGDLDGITEMPVNSDAIVAELSSRGDTVKDIQQRLIQLSILVDVPDGRYGSNTVQAVKIFQNSVGLEPTGKVTEAVYRALKTATRRDGVGELQPFILLFNAAEQLAEENAKLDPEQFADAQGQQISVAVDEYVTVTITMGERDNMTSIIIEGKLDGFAEAEQSVFNAFIATLTGCGASSTMYDGEAFLKRLGAYNGALVETGIGVLSQDGIRYGWEAGAGATTLIIEIDG